MGGSKSYLCLLLLALNHKKGNIYSAEDPLRQYPNKKKGRDDSCQRMRESEKKTKGNWNERTAKKKGAINNN